METLHFEVYTSLRNLLREADHLTHEQLLYRILLMSDEHYEKYETLMLETLVKEQMDPNHTRYDYGLVE
jgi:hypothetical protein